MKKIVLTLIIMSFTIIGANCANVVIEAANQQINLDNNKGFFSGDVKVKVGDVTVKSPRAELDLEPKSKKPSLAVFFDNPYAFQNKDNKKHEIKANIMKVSLINKTLRAEGNTQSIMMKDRQPLIMINSDSQEYDTNTKVMRADGSVIVHYQDVETFSNSASAIIDKNGEVQNLKLTGNVVMKEKSNVLKGNKFEYKPAMQEYQMSGNTSTDVTFEDGSRLYVTARFQQYNRNTNNIIAGGNVCIKFKDYTAVGPKAQVFIDKATQKPNKVVFTGRSKITQGASTVEADVITMTMNPKEFNATGNVKTSISGGSSDDNMEIMP